MDVRSFYGGGARRPRTTVKGRAKKPFEKKVLPKRTRTAVAKVAKQVLNRMVETKHAYQTLFTTWMPQYGHTIPAGGQPQLYNGLFDINQGDTAMDRQGNIIRPTKLYTDLQIMLNDRTSDVGGSNSLAYDGWDITVHVWYGVTRNYNRTFTVLADAPSILGNMFDNQFSPGSQTAWTGKFTDQLNPVNKETYLLKHKSVRLSKGPGIVNTADAVSSSRYEPAKTFAQMRLSFKPPKQMHFNDLEGLPTDYAPFFVIGYCHNDSTQAANTVTGTGLLTKPAIQIQASQHLFFKDA